MKKIFNPLAYYGEYTLLAIGGVMLLIGVLLSYQFSIIHHGILQASPGEYNLWQYTLAMLIDLSTLTLCTFILGKCINPKTRFIDILNVNLIARIPLHILPIIAGNTTMHTFLEASSNMSPNALLHDPNFMSNTVIILVFAFISIALLAIFILLLILGFKTAVHPKKYYHYIILCIIIIIADIMSRILNYYLIPIQS